MINHSNSENSHSHSHNSHNSNNSKGHNSDSSHNGYNRNSSQNRNNSSFFIAIIVINVIIAIVVRVSPHYLIPCSMAGQREHRARSRGLAHSLFAETLF